MNGNRISRRRFLQLGGLGLGTLALAACVPAAPSTAGDEAAAMEPVVIRFHGRTGVQGDHFIERARAFEEENPGIQIKEELFPHAEYHQKMEVLLAGQTIGDTFWTVLLSGLYHRYANQGVLLALDDLIAADDYDTSVFFPESLVAASHEGSLYSLPWICHPGRVGCYYNKQLFADNNLEEPPVDGDWTFEDLLSAAQVLTQDTDGDGQIDQFGMQPGRDPFSLLVWVRGNGGELYGDEGNTSLLDSEESLAAIQFVYDLMHTHNVAPTPEQQTSDMFVSGRIGMAQSGYWGQSWKARIGDRFELGGVPMPKGSAGVMGSMYEFDPACIYAGTEHPEEAFAWAKWLANQETGIRIAEAGSVPGSRPDVWESERLTKFPIHNVFTQIMYNVMPFQGPGNFRGLEIRDAYTNGMDPVWLGNEEPAAVVSEVAAKLQEILDKPAA